MYLGAEAYSAVSLLGPFTGVIGCLQVFSQQAARWSARR